MKIISKFTFISLVALLCFASAGLKAQQQDTLSPQPDQQQLPTRTYRNRPLARKKQVDSYFDESGGFARRLWYGGNVGLGYSSSPDYNTGGNYSSFNISLYPMIGYKFDKHFSAGPRFGVGYQNIKAVNSNNAYSSLNLVNYSVAAFARYKVIANFFVHTEYGYDDYENYGVDQYGRIGLDQNNKPVTARANRTNFYAGVGYNSGGSFGYEILALYNFNLPSSSPESPFDLRFGFTYNF